MQSGPGDLYLFILSNLDKISDSDITNGSLSYWVNCNGKVGKGESGS